MSELIDNATERKQVLKRLITRLNEGRDVEAVRDELVRVLGQVPYGDVVEVEQQLVNEGLDTGKLLGLCDLHTQALAGAIDHTGAKHAPAGHPVHTFRQENRALEAVLERLARDLAGVASEDPTADATDKALSLLGHFHELMDVDKHYRRKENLLFPFLEKRDITGPPTVMWGKDDEVRDKLKQAVEVLGAAAGATFGDLQGLSELVLGPAAEAVHDMIGKEENILFPMCLDTLTDAEWLDIKRQSPEIGYCLVDPSEAWTPAGSDAPELGSDVASTRILLPTGSFALPELAAVLNTLPVDVTFVDQDDRVRYFSQGKERIFDRNRAVLGRKVQFCHPPSSVHMVERILSDFREGRQDRAAFWIQLHGRFIHIEYFAVRSPEGEYLGTLEVTQDLTSKRKLEGQRRLLTYDEPEASHGS